MRAHFERDIERQDRPPERQDNLPQRQDRLPERQDRVLESQGRQPENQKEESKGISSQILKEIEYEKRKGDQSSPQEQREQRPKMQRGTEIAKEIPRPPTPSRPTKESFSIPSSPPRQGGGEELVLESDMEEDLPEIEIQQAESLENRQDTEIETRRKKYAKYSKELNLIIIKQKEIGLQRRDWKEVSQLVKAGKMKYVYTNSSYTESECKTVWESGFVDLNVIEIKTVSKDFYLSIEKNGKLLKDRRSSTGAVSRWR